MIESYFPVMKNTFYHRGGSIWAETCTVQDHIFFQLVS